MIPMRLSDPTPATIEVDAPTATERPGLDPKYLEVVSSLSPIHPDALRVLELGRAAKRPPIEQQTPDQARAAYAAARRVVAAPPADVKEVRDIPIPGPGGQLLLRFYRGIESPDRSPALIYFHGGGWVLGDLDSHDSVCRELANSARARVISVDYRLAPENPFPAAVEDAVAAATWLGRHAHDLGIDPGRIAVGGDSAGGNLAAVLALMGRDRSVPRFDYQVLIYPVTDLSCSHDAHRRDIPDLGLTSSAMRWFIAHYLGGDGDRLDWRASPLRAISLSGSPPAFIVTAGHDPLCDEGEAYARRLADDGAAVTHRHLPDQIHGFIAMGRLIGSSSPIIQEIGTALDRHWRKRRPGG